jgi:hypothetical protein
VCNLGNVGEKLMEKGCVNKSECKNDNEWSDNLMWKNGKWKDKCVKSEGVRWGNNDVCKVFENVDVC